MVRPSSWTSRLPSNDSEPPFASTPFVHLANQNVSILDFNTNRRLRISFPAASVQIHHIFFQQYFYSFIDHSPLDDTPPLRLSVKKEKDGTKYRFLHCLQRSTPLTWRRSSWHEKKVGVSKKFTNGCCEYSMHKRIFMWEEKLVATVNGIRLRNSNPVECNTDNRNSKYINLKAWNSIPALKSLGG